MKNFRSEELKKLKWSKIGKIVDRTHLLTIFLHINKRRYEMAVVNPLNYNDTRTKAINKIESDVPRCVNNINNIVNKAAGEGKFSALVSLYQEGFSITTVSKALEKFRQAGYETISEDNRMIKISWELEL